MMTRLKDLRKAHGEKVQALRTIQDKAAAEKRDLLTADEDAAVLRLLDEAEQLAEQIKIAERIQEQELIATRAEAQRAVQHVEVTQNREPGSAIANIVRAIAGGRNQHIHPAKYASDILRDEQVSKALSVGTSSAGGYLVPSDLSTEVYAALRAASVIRRAGARTIALPSGKLDLPRVNTGSAATWIGENTNVQKTEPVIGRVQLSFKKLGALVPISNDLIRYSAPDTNMLVQDDIVMSLAAAADIAYIRGAIGGDNPVGIANQVAAGQKAAMTATPDFAKVRSDLLKCMQRVVSANVMLFNPGWLMSARTLFYLRSLQNSVGALAFPELNENRLLGYPVYMSTQIPENLGAGTNETEVYFVEFSHCIIGEARALNIDVSDTAAYHDGTNVVSAFSLDQTVIRVIEETDFGLRYDKSAAMITGVTWQ